MNDQRELAEKVYFSRTEMTIIRKAMERTSNSKRSSFIREASLQRAKAILDGLTDRETGKGMLDPEFIEYWTGVWYTLKKAGRKLAYG